MVSAVMLSSPDVVKPGEEVSIFIGNIGAGDPFQIDIIGNIKIDAGSFFSFKLNKLNLPLDIANPTLRVYINGLVPDSKLNVSVNQKKYNEVFDTADSTGLYDYLIVRSGMPKGIYNVEINGTAAKTQVPVTFSITGTNTNAEPLAESTFSISGFSSGTFDVKTYVKNLAQPVERKQFTVQDQFIATK
ncbi:MAG: hypothetical protein GX268_08440 [Methanomicrobiales archaeon]|jgi:hypothetical protein|nr:hypothetical protein [Methanomicrobiales archaeon]